MQVLAAQAQRIDGFHLDHPAREHMAPKLRVFIDFMREALDGGVGRLQGVAASASTR